MAEQIINTHGGVDKIKVFYRDGTTTTISWYDNEVFAWEQKGYCLSRDVIEKMLMMIEDDLK